MDRDENTIDTETPEEDAPLDLDSLLAESLTERDARKAKAAERKPSKGIPPAASWMNPKERADYNRQVENARLRGLWRPDAVAAMISRQICLNCGHTHDHFEGYFQHQTHASGLHVERWVLCTDSTMRINLPLTRKLTVIEADACADCLSSLGYVEPHTSSQLEPHYATWQTRQKHSKYSDQSEPPRGFGSAAKTSFME